MAPPGAKGNAFRVTLPPLDTGPVPLHGIREQARRGLLDMIDARRGGRKVLMLDPSLSGPLGCLDTHMAELLAEHGVTRIHYVDGRPLDDPAYNPAGADNRVLDARSVIWLVRSNVLATQRAVAQIKSLTCRPAGQGSAGQGSGASQDLVVCFVPRRTIACNRVLEEEGVGGDVTVCEWGLELVPLEEDVLSLELDAAFKECVLEGDSSSLYAMARALVRLQAMWGVIPRLQGKGPAAAAVRDMVLRMWRENPQLAASAATAQGGGAPRISRAVLIDREVDMVTPCLTQITLEGLIDEVTGIKGGTVPWAPKDKRAEAALGGAPDLGGTPPGSGANSASSTAMLNSTDPYWKELRDLPYHMAITRLQAAARDARREYEGLGSKDLAQLKTFVKGLPKLLLLDRLSDIASPVAEQVRQQLFHDRLKHELDAVEGVEVDSVLSFTQELMYRGAPLLDVLRLLVLASVTGTGVPRRPYDALREDLLVTYGHEHALTLSALERAGLLQVATSSRSPFQGVRRALRLVVPEPEDAGPDTPPTDLAHIYRGYAPLSIRLVETALSPLGWGRAGSTLAEALSLLPGAAFDIPQVLTGPGDAAPAMPATEPAPGLPVVLVAFLGGATYSEISALRWLGTKLQVSFLIVTSQVINGKSLLSTFVDPLVVPGAARLLASAGTSKAVSSAGGAR